MLPTLEEHLKLDILQNGGVVPAKAMIEIMKIVQQKNSQA